VHPREVFKGLCMDNAAAFVAVHNHPSGDPTPSMEDRRITERLRRAGELMGITLLDHVIIGASLGDATGTRGEYFSFVDEGW